MVCSAALLAACAAAPPAETAESGAPDTPPAESSGGSAQQQATASSPTATTPEDGDGVTAGGQELNAAGFKRWVANFRRRARARGVSTATLNTAFDRAALVPRIVQLDSRQPEFSRPIWAYLDSAVSAARVRAGRSQLAAHANAAGEVERRYGVSRFIIGAIWGVESNYGQNFGDFETVNALATLGYQGRRDAFAERQLYAALQILADGDISRSRMRGSWAGAMGHTQFLPTSFLAYAVDADGDGRRDIWGSIPDVLASTANYLQQHGWQAGAPWGREVALNTGFDYGRADGDSEHATAWWQAHGVRAIDRRGLPEFSSAALIAPAGARGAAFLVGPNFQVIKRYNNSTSYALAVGVLADRLAGRAGVQAAWPRQLAPLSRTQIRQLQANLNRLGYASGTPDGIVGPNTQAGVRAFQRARGLTADGYPTQALLRTISAAASS